MSYLELARVIEEGGAPFAYVLLAMLVMDVKAIKAAIGSHSQRIIKLEQTIYKEPARVLTAKR